jgi:hypothetical protein
MNTRVPARIALVRVTIALAAFVHFGTSLANAAVCVRPNFAPPPLTPAGKTIPFTVLFGNALGFDPNLTDPSNGDDSFNYYLRIGPGSITYIWLQGKTQANDSCDISRTITFKDTFQKTYTTTSSQSIQSSLTSTLGTANVASIGSTIGATASISESFTQGQTSEISDSVIIPKCSVVTWWHQYRIANFDFYQGRQEDWPGFWRDDLTIGNIRFTEYTQSTITSAQGTCVPEPSSVISFAITMCFGALIQRARRKRPVMAS